MSRRFEDNMTKKHLWIRQLSSLLFLVGVLITGCGNTVDDQDAGPQCAGSGCDAGPQCAADEYFRYDDGLCGNGSPAGWCESVNAPCAPDFPLCGCDGTVYSSTCDSRKARVDIHRDAKQCTAPPDMFPCGRTYCTRNTMFCDEIISDSEGVSDFFCDFMVPLCPSAPSCECLLKTYDECEDDGMGGFYVTEWIGSD